jgi:hypothetical protein
VKLILVLALFSSQIIYAATSHVGRIIKKQGKAELYYNPSKTVTGKGPHVLFKGLYYNFKALRLGAKINNGNIVKTGKDSKLKIVYKNGDQFNIGEGTSFEIKWKSNKSPPTGNLLYGSIRGIISKSGARSGLIVKSRSAVMGVRGTDFNFTQRGTSGKSAIAVIRGKVDVANIKKPLQKIKIKQGYSAELKLAPKRKSSNKIKTSILAVTKTTKKELVRIQKDSKIEKEKEDKATDKKTKLQISKLHMKAVNVTLNDIKEYQPELYEEIKKKKISTIDSINTTVISKAYETAPEKKIKPGFDEMDLDLEDDAYERYFKVD